MQILASEIDAPLYGHSGVKSCLFPLSVSARVYVTLILTHGAVFILTHSVAMRKFRLESKSDPSTAIANTSVEPSRTLAQHWLLASQRSASQIIARCAWLTVGTS